MSTAKHFVSSQNVPEFIKQDHELFDTFVRAYYEWLSLRNDSDSIGYSDAYKSVGNPGYIIDHHEIITDLDETIDEFIDYFAQEVVPISLEGIQTDPRFFMKKIRDLYLAKGTVQSFVLFFKLYYNEDIDVFETRDTVLRASDGKFFAFPTAHFKVCEYQDQFSNMEFTLSELLDSEDNLLSVVLDASIAGEAPEGEIILKVRFTTDIQLDAAKNYYIKSATDNTRLLLCPLVSIENLTISEYAPLYENKDPFFLKSKELNKDFYGSLNAATRGRVNGIKVRDQGYYYTVGDIFRFTDGNDTVGYFEVTEVDTNGSIKSIDNIQLRTGSTNNGYSSLAIEDAYISITQGGSNWTRLPDIQYVSRGSYQSDIGKPYIASIKEGFGLQAIPVSNDIGIARKLTFTQESYFLNDSDVQVIIPANIVIENNNLRKGDLVSFQYFNNEANFGPFVADSETVTLKYLQYRLFETHIETDYIYKESEIRTQYDITIPYYFDSDLFDWRYRNVRVDSNFTNFWQEVEKLLESESNLSYKLYKRTYDPDIIDGGGYPANFHYEVWHPIDELGNKLKYTVEAPVGWSGDGTYLDYNFVTYTLDADDDSEVFDNITTFLGLYHKGQINIQSAVMLDVEEVDGGPTFEHFLYDSDYDGGSTYGTFGESVIEGWPSFEYIDGKYSWIRISYPDYTSDSEVSAAQSFATDSETTILDGGNWFGFAGSTIEDLEIEYEGRFLSTLEKYHFNQLDNAVGMDSEYLDFSYKVTDGILRILDNDEDSDMGNWVDTGHFGEVVGVGHNNQVVKVIDALGSDLPTQEQIDYWSSDYKKVVRLSKVLGGVSNKEGTLPLNNVIHELKRAKASYDVAVVTTSASKFYTTDGFTSSAYGGHIIDDYFYSDWSYRIKTKLPFENWRKKFKTLLHPAGMVLTAEYVDTFKTPPIQTNTLIDINTRVNSRLTFDQQNEFICFDNAPSITADNMHYGANAFEAYNAGLGISYQLEASNIATIRDVHTKTQMGNSWWDYEPVGWVKEYSTQDSDGNGYVKNGYRYYNYYLPEINDFYKNNSRVDKNYRNIMVSKVQFEDLNLDIFSAYDSDLPHDLFAHFNDSDSHFKSIDYGRLKSDSDNRLYFYAKVERLAEIDRRKNRNLQTAMHEEGLLVWDDSDKIYVDYDAYERKWNQINNRRTINLEYVQFGAHEYNSYIYKRQNEEYRRNTVANASPVSYKLIKPYTLDAWEYPSLKYRSEYYGINKTIGSVDDKSNYELRKDYKDPKISMKGRKG